MYIPPAFRIEDERIMFALMRSYDFALVMVPGEADASATHIPLKLDDERRRLIGHVAMANPIADHIRAGRQALAVFTGPHAYVSPTWHGEPNENVPTWNYMAVHVEGQFVPLEGENAERSLSSQIADFESVWRITDIEVGKRARLEAAIQAFELEITSLKGKAKLSQNKSAEDRRRLADALMERGENALAHKMMEGVS